MLTPSILGVYLSSTPRLEAYMLQVKLKATGQLISVTNNEAHGLLESGLATLNTKQNKERNTRQMRASRSKRYKTKRL